MARIRDVQFIGFEDATVEGLAQKISAWAARTASGSVAPEEGYIVEILYESTDSGYSALVAYTGAGE